MENGQTADDPRDLLLAEDDDDLRELMASALSGRGYRVTECVDGRDLVSKLGSYILFGPPARFDLIISDIVMPGATALEVLEAIRDCAGTPPVILTTAFPSDDTRATAKKLGVVALFEKPFDLSALVAKVDRLLSPVQEARRGAC